jgi:heterodisulfide reductase subunit A2
MSKDAAAKPDKPAPEDRRIGVFICHCGGNISDYVDVNAVREALADEPGVVVSETTVFACSDGTQHDMIDAIRAEKLDGLVVASCSPKLHQVTFRNVASRADLNPYTYTQVNVREQASWAHPHDKAGATEKVIGLVRAGVAKSRLSDPLQALRVQTLPRTLVIGGGIAGLRAAIGLAEIGIEAILVERSDHLGGWVGGFGAMFPNDDSGRDQVASLVEQITQRRDITVYTNAEVTGKAGSFGNYEMEVTLHREGSDKTLQVDVGAIIVATGFDSYDPASGEYGYGMDGVVTLPQFKELVDSSAAGELSYQGRPVRSLAYIYCVGSRQRGGNEHCSKYCCTSAIHTSLLVNNLDPAIRQFHVYRDVRAYGKYELLYNESREGGSTYLKFDADTPPEVAKLDSGALGVTVTDLLTQSQEVTLPVDLVVLVTGMVPRENTSLVELLKVPVGTDGFFNEIHPKLRPVETVVDGLLIAGCCQSPRTVGESVSAGLAAVAQSAALLKKGYADLDPLVARIDPDKCISSGECLTVCPYGSITSIEWDGRMAASIDPATCKGCGGCVPVCGSDAIELLGYTDEQMLAAIEEMVITEVPDKEPVA